MKETVSDEAVFFLYAWKLSIYKEKKKPQSSQRLRLKTQREIGNPYYIPSTQVSGNLKKLCIKQKNSYRSYKYSFLLNIVQLSLEKRGDPGGCGERRH